MVNTAQINSTEKKWLWAALILLAFAYISHINYYPINVGTDEGIRALVAMEMNYTGDYIVPRLNGELYLNKPPMFNWILALSFKIFGYNAFALRLPTIISIFILGFLVFYFARRYINEKVAWIAAFLYMTNGRALIYDSMLGYIDLTYAWVTFLGFMVVFVYGEKKEYYKLFIISYIIMSVGYLLKGFPSFGFQGLTLLGYFIYTKNFKKLFHPAHFIGVFVFLVIVGGYYLLYFNKIELSPLAVFKNLLSESTQRTPFFHDVGLFFKHLIKYPYELLYHYGPGMYFFILLLRKDWRQIIKSNRFVLFCAIIFAVNILIYWLSPKIFARYIFMHLALLFTVFAYFYYQSAANDIRKKILDTFFLVVTILFFIACFLLPFHWLTSHVDRAMLKSTILIPVFGFIIWHMIKYPQYRIVHTFFMIAVFRLGFNWFVFVQRGAENVVAENDGAKIAEITKGQPLYIQGRPLNHSLGSIGDKNATSFNIARYRKDIIRFNDTIDYNAFYLTHPDSVTNLPHKLYYKFDNPEIDSAILIKFIPLLQK